MLETTQSPQPPPSSDILSRGTGGRFLDAERGSEMGRCHSPSYRARPRLYHRKERQLIQRTKLISALGGISGYKGLRPFAAGSVARDPTRQPVRINASITPKDNTDFANSVSALAMALLMFSITHAQGRLSTAEEASPMLYCHGYRNSRTHAKV
jgi:hypothetical protein